ncbi:TonB-dependent receptor [Sphingomonas sp. SUN019]|uniref:TonB-dependent receptor domain-containing protein n=1 Tax=Sphingomonas sp. SUN019 TaxID=2937788 RepID=UPI002164CD4C|nr:TonB-dependent receptor [Sphingomonas sp. SUN019]UVO52319.1 TonB-dependent receptor [Sphingomonas sp. SUN019]
MKTSRTLLVSSASAIALFGANLAAAQAGAPVEATQTTNQAVDPTVEQAGDVASGDVVVTGSRIRSPNLESTSPISVVSGAELFETGQVAVGDTLNDLPQLRSTFSQANSTAFLGTRGINLLDLRGLGTQRTLVLQNGRRHVAGDILVNGVSPDVNTFPTDLIERVEILTGGGSSIYGSDAIAGVVNFVLKKDYEGLQLRGQSGVSADYKDAGNQYLSLLAGKNFADGRGNVAINLEYAHQSRYFAGDRPIGQNDAFVVTDTDPAGTANGSDGVFDRTYFRDIRSATISEGGQLGLAQSRTNPRCGADALGNPFTCGFLFRPDGTLAAQTGQRVGIGPNGNYIGGNGYSGREQQLKLLALSPDVKRYSANLLAHFEISPAFVPFVEAKYVRTEAFGSQSGPFFNQGVNLENSPGLARDRIRLDNPYLTAQARTVLTQNILAAGVDPNSTATTPAALTAAQRAAIADGSFRFALRRNFVELGIRDEQIRRETYRAVVGVRGDFNDDWNYEISANYGEHRERNIIDGNISRQRYLLAADAVRNAAGQIVCRSQIDPTAAGVDRAGNAAQLAADVAACAPINPLGEGNISQAARDYLTVQSRAEGKITQFVASGFVAGDLSQLFELPGGPVSFSVGAEYRRETNYYDLDDYTQAGYAFYNAIPSFDAPAFEVKEVFGELRVPILKDMPFFHELTISGSGRIADYKGATGTVYAYSGGVEWSPVEDIRFRGTYSRSVRAPNLSELFSAQGQNFAPLFVDPCSERNIATGSATRSANCTAAGRPAGYDYVYQSSLDIISGGNPDLREEKSDSYTAGVVVQPRFIPGLSISADYFDITVDNVITSVSAQQIANLCYDSATLDNPFCGLFQRAGASGGARGEIPFRILEGSLLQSTLNFAKLKARGVDVNASYRHTFDFGQLNLGAIWTRTIQRDSFTNPANPDFQNRILGELGDPKNQVNVNASLKTGPITIGYQGRYIGPMYLNTYEDYNALNGLPPQNTDYAPVKFYTEVFYHDVRVNIEAGDKFDFYIGVDNVANRLPPFGLTGIGAGSAIYDIRGRYAYAGFVAKF